MNSAIIFPTLIAYLWSLADSSGATTGHDHSSFGDPTAVFSFGCSQNRTFNDIYAFPDDCHTFFHWIDATATGTIYQCQTGTYFNKTVLQCLPEGKTQCTDRCQDGDDSAPACFPDPDCCSSFFTCDQSLAMSVRKCCPPLTSFNATTCQCDPDPTCTTTCIDDDTGISSTVEPSSSNQQCQLYLPFDDDIKDHSAFHIPTFAFGNWSIDRKVYARGGGSLHVQGGRVEVLDLKTFHMGKAASWCFFYKCQNERYCHRGGILSNRKSRTATDDDHFSFAAGEQFTDVVREFATFKLAINLGFAATGNVRFSIDNFPFTFHSRFSPVCVVYNGSHAQVFHASYYESDAEVVVGEVTVDHCPYTIGSDLVLGDFRGWIDEVLICDHAMTYDQVLMHLAGRPSLEHGGLVPKELPEPLKYVDVPVKAGPERRCCGHNKYWYHEEDITPVLLGADTVKDEEFPWLSFVYAMADLSDDASYLDNVTCSGSVLSQNYVLTEAYCCANFWSTPSSTNLVAFFGLKNYDARHEWNPAVASNYATKRNISEIIIHPNYTAGSTDDKGRFTVKNDFCLLKLEEPLSFNKWCIQPICVPTNCDDFCQEPTGYDDADGYGLKAIDYLIPVGSSNELKRATVPIVAQDVCNASFYEGGLSMDAETSFCAGYFWQGGPEACLASDSGSPFMTYHRGYFSLDGIVLAYATGCAEPRFPSLYGRVCAVADWIYSYIRYDV